MQKILQELIDFNTDTNPDIVKLNDANVKIGNVLDEYYQTGSF